MKKYLLLFIVAISTQITYAQYRPLPMQNAEWVNWGGLYLLSCPACTFVNYKYYTDGDTIINTQTYVKIKKTEIPAINNVNVYPTYTGAIRQDTLNKKIYVILTDSTTERILYDFSLQVGDTLNSVLHDLANDCVGFNVETVSSIDSILINGNYHKIFYIQGSCSDMSLGYIEGIGSSYGLIFPNRLDEKESHLSCTKVNGQTYYPSSTSSCDLVTSLTNLDADMAIDVYPNPSYNEINIIIPNAEKSTTNIITLFSPIGQILIREKINSKKHIIDISEFPQGLYLISISVNEKVITKKILKQ
jgi:hypothetical protein